MFLFGIICGCFLFWLPDENSLLEIKYRKKSKEKDSESDRTERNYSTPSTPDYRSERRRGSKASSCSNLNMFFTTLSILSPTATLIVNWITVKSYISALTWMTQCNCHAFWSWLVWPIGLCGWATYRVYVLKNNGVFKQNFFYPIENNSDLFWSFVIFLLLLFWLVVKEH